MASVYRKSGRWYVRYVNGAGRRVAVATVATTKRDAARVASELERRAWHQRQGLAPLPSDSTWTVGDLAQWWIEAHASKLLGYETEKGRVRLHILEAPLAAVPVRSLDTARVNAYLAEREALGLSPASVNKLRAALLSMFSRASKLGVWNGPNPAIDSERRRLPKRIRETLKAEEVPRLLTMLAPRYTAPWRRQKGRRSPEGTDWRPLFAMAIYTGLRKGELLGLRKGDVDLDAGTIVVRCSYDNDTTKGGHADTLPIAAGLRPYLAAALAASPSELVFPAPDGSMRDRDTDLHDTLKAALGRAGIVDGYEHRCRRCASRGSPHVERHPDRAPRRCPACKMLLWPVALPRKIRFHDLRHTTATLLLKAGVPLAVVQRVMRHSDPRITTETYGHLDLGDLRAGIERMGIPPPETPPDVQSSAVPAAVGAGSLLREAPIRLPSGTPAPPERENREETADARLDSTVVAAASEARDAGFEPAAYGSGARTTGVAGGGAASQVGGPTGHGGRPVEPRRLPATGNEPPSGTHAPPARALGLRVIDGGADDLLSVQAVAKRLSLSSATVYRLCGRGELVHVRIGNAIRVRREDLEALVTSKASHGRGR